MVRAACRGRTLGTGGGGGTYPACRLQAPVLHIPKVQRGGPRSAVQLLACLLLKGLEAASGVRLPGLSPTSTTPRCVALSKSLKCSEPQLSYLQLRNNSTFFQELCKLSWTIRAKQIGVESTDHPCGCAHRKHSRVVSCYD